MPQTTRRHPPSGFTAVPWGAAGEEPDLADVLADPVVHLVMRRDGVSHCELRAVIAAARAKLRRGLCCCMAP
jgi:hypothetical protein